ncbi:hypothetical protein L6452_28317 [Arctium lappa]|uniref:Uncharacterized protein n=1 Tax=Arctium lappa TaxID=4217 RepID=A0ACB8ZXZ0_ARCLA|nr:hypothetical protein L6452_28317 [Arctium lappa]
MLTLGGFVESEVGVASKFNPVKNHRLKPKAPIPSINHLACKNQTSTMSLASSSQSFFTNALLTAPAPHKSNQIPKNSIIISSNAHKQETPPKDSSRINENNNQLAKLALMTMAAGVLTLGSVDPAFAAKSGGRVGGQAFRSAPQPSSPRSSSPRINNSRTNIYINPRVAPPLVGGYGYGWGWSPFSYFAPGPSVVAVGGGFDTLLLFMLLGAAAAVVRSFFRSRNDDEDY